MKNDYIQSKEKIKQTLPSLKIEAKYVFSTDTQVTLFFTHTFRFFFFLNLLQCLFEIYANPER